MRVRNAMLRSQPMPAALTLPKEMSAGRYGSAWVSSWEILSMPILWPTTSEPVPHLGIASRIQS
jgi:hypothetical protein